MQQQRAEADRMAAVEAAAGETAAIRASAAAPKPRKQSTATERNFFAKFEAEESARLAAVAAELQARAEGATGGNRGRPRCGPQPEAEGDDFSDSDDSDSEDEVGRCAQRAVGDPIIAAARLARLLSRRNVDAVLKEIEAVDKKRNKFGPHVLVTRKVCPYFSRFGGYY